MNIVSSSILVILFNFSISGPNEKLVYFMKEMVYKTTIIDVISIRRPHFIPLCSTKLLKKDLLYVMSKNNIFFPTQTHILFETTNGIKRGRIEMTSVIAVVKTIPLIKCISFYLLCTRIFLLILILKS